jgi:peptidoglycan/xylan/chitin deacetylase (PgdA/CDA1 family)
VLSPGRILLGVVLTAAFAITIRAALGAPPPGWVALGCLLLLLLVFFGGALWLRLEMYGPVLWRGPEERDGVALTFDDGPLPASTPRVLDCLAEHGARATFFVIGERALQHPELIRRMVREGHTVGLHGMQHHRGYAFLSPASVERDLQLAMDAVGAAGVPRPLWFRPPIGQASPRTFAGVRRAGLEVVGWSFRARDGWRTTDADQLLRRLERGLRPGAIVLLHDAWERPGPQGEQPPLGVRLLPQILDMCQARGLRPVSLDELIQTEARGSSTTKRAPGA